MLRLKLSDLGIKIRGKHSITVSDQPLEIGGGDTAQHPGKADHSNNCI